MLVDFNDEILIPKGDVGGFAVIACDQFTSDPEYWQKVEAEMKNSALDFILPECYLAEAESRIAEIKRRSGDIDKRFNAVRGAVAVTRTTSYGRVRHGIVASIDLDAYDYTPGSEALIRASERTIAERIPPRVKIRNELDIELPHVLLLVDDREDLLAKAVAAAKKTRLYDADLCAGGGHITGELIEDSAALDAAAEKLIEQSQKLLGTKLFALVGDGNHSLATAKYCREHYPTPYNSRALVEIINIYDEGLVVEPIHRLVRFDDAGMFIDSFKSAIKGDGETTLYTPEPVKVHVPSDKVEAIKAVDGFCEAFTRHFGGSVDYVHGADALRSSGCIGIEMRAPEKSELFGYVVKNGVLPKKTFSLGEAEEKRYYIEARRIK